MSNSAKLAVLIGCSFVLSTPPIVPEAHARAVSTVVLPVDQKLLGVSWRCGNDGACAPWFLTTLMSRKDAARSYTFSDGERTVLVTESRSPGNWPWEDLRTMPIAKGQRLLGVSWRCARNGTCAPWFFTVPLENAEPRAYVLTDGVRVILIHEDSLP